MCGLYGQWDYNHSAVMQSAFSVNKLCVRYHKTSGRSPWLTLTPSRYPRPCICTASVRTCQNHQFSVFLLVRVLNLLVLKGPNSIQWFSCIKYLGLDYHTYGCYETNFLPPVTVCWEILLVLMTLFVWTSSSHTVSLF